MRKYIIRFWFSFIILNYCKAIKAQDTASYYQFYINREKQYLKALFNCKSEREFFITVSKIKANSSIWRYLPFFHPLYRNNIIVSSGFGYRVHPVTGKFKFHKGIDIPANCGTKVLSTGDGYVLDVGYDKYLGNFVKIGHGFNWVSLYGHLSQINVHIGQRVTVGQVIGLSGTTGRSTGCHLHYAIYYNKQAAAPLKYIDLFKKCLEVN